MAPRTHRALIWALFLSWILPCSKDPNFYSIPETFCSAFPPSSILFIFHYLLQSPHSQVRRQESSWPGERRKTGWVPLAAISACSDPALGALIHRGRLSRDHPPPPVPTCRHQALRWRQGGPTLPKSPILPAMTCLWGRCDGAPLPPALVTDEGGSLAMVPWQRCHGNGTMATGECQGDVGGSSRGCVGILVEAEGPQDPPGLGLPPQAWPPNSIDGPKLCHHWGFLRGSGAPDPSWVPGRVGR